MMMRMMMMLMMMMLMMMMLESSCRRGLPAVAIFDHLVLGSHPLAELCRHGNQPPLLNNPPR
eukprot:10900901-Karenia_brevis.AAC.1